MQKERIFKMQDYIRNQKAEEYRQLCSITGAIADGKNAEIPSGWQLVESQKQDKTNFKAAVYKKGDELLICFAGTEALSAKDQGANLKMATGNKSAQMDYAEKYYRKIINDYHEKYPYLKIVLAGHSEGGSESIYVGLKNDVETYTFNAFTPGEKILEKIQSQKTTRINPNLITNYRDPHDPVSKLLNPDIGKTYIVENTYNNLFAKSPFGLLTAHKIKNMGSCANAVPIEEYKKTHKLFIDKLKNIQVTNRDIKEIGDAGLFGVYEDEISQRVKTGNVIHQNFANQLVRSGNLVYVEGYTRDDGTDVKGYYRHLPESGIAFA